MSVLPSGSSDASSSDVHLELHSDDTRREQSIENRRFDSLQMFVLGRERGVMKAFIKADAVALRKPLKILDHQHAHANMRAAAIKCGAPIPNRLQVVDPRYRALLVP